MVLLYWAQVTLLVAMAFLGIVIPFFLGFLLFKKEGRFLIFLGGRRSKSLSDYEEQLAVMAERVYKGLIVCVLIYAAIWVAMFLGGQK